MNSDEAIRNILVIFFEHYVCLKMFHFQTKFYRSHKASDKYLEEFLENFDKFMEVFQGNNKKFEFDKLEMKTIQLTNDEEIEMKMKNFVRTLQKFEKLFKNYADIMNIRDDMIVNANKFIYLLKFE